MDMIVNDLVFTRDSFCLTLDNLTIHNGDKVAVIGLNGSGKTTLFECLLGLQAYRGSVSILGKCPKKEFKKIIPHVAYCMQNPDNQLFCATVRDDILFAPRNFSPVSIYDEQQLIENVNKQIDIRELLDKAPNELSYGEKKRCVIASCLAYNPGILLFDEPTSMLDKRQKRLF
ncbi:MAG: ABC transporter ATP-binding protein, partial [Oligoflexia bacterium]|nr:ABC transporter ATP-binding protein [Oligoflexia bacterium]